MTRSSCNFLALTVNALCPVRRMRGGAQSYLLTCDDCASYVTKFRDNPQHRRILVNEWLGSAILEHLEITSPAVRMVRITLEFLKTYPDVDIQLRSRVAHVTPGLHFGSRYIGSQRKPMIFDFLPDSMLGKVKNLNEFLGVLAFDKWVGNVDGRQSVFTRSRQDRPDCPSVPRRTTFIVHMIDNGFIFGGPEWSIRDSPLQGLYFRPEVYRTVSSMRDFAPWLDRIASFSEEVLRQARDQIPSDWLESDEPALDQLLCRLLARRRRVPDLVLACRQAGIFPRWL